MKSREKQQIESGKIGLWALWGIVLIAGLMIVVKIISVAINHIN